MGLEARNIGPCEAFYGGSSLGETKGGTKIAVSMSTAKSTTDKTGETARQKIVTGTEVKVTVNLTELGASTLASLIPGASGSTAVSVKSSVGTDLVAGGKVLILKPIVDGVASTDESEWITLPNASCTPTLDVPIELENQKVWTFEFEGHPDADGVLVVFGGDEGEGS